MSAVGVREHAGFRALAVLLATRVPVFVVGYLAVRLVGVWPPPVDAAVWRVYANDLLNLPARWDAFWYYSIATEGYRWSGQVLDQQSVVFFPMYPLLMRASGALTGHPLLGGVALSLTAFFFALVYLYRLARLDLEQAEAWTAIALLACYPFAVFFGAPYTESLFLLELAAAIYYVRRGAFVLAAAAAFFAGLTRPHGCVLALPLLVLAWQQARRAESIETRRSRGVAPLLVASAPVLGALTYSAFLWRRFGHPFLWIANQAAWGLTFVPNGRVPPIVGPHFQTPVASAIVLVGNIAAIVFAVAMIGPVWRRFGAAYALLVLVYVTPAFLAHAFTSAGRFTSVLFPMFFMLATMIPREHRTAWIASFAAGEAVAAALFFSWRPLV